MSRLIILDRDGVINQDSDHYIKSADEFIAIPGSLEAIAQLCKADYAVMVATNQSGIARQLFTLATLEAMHNKLQVLLAPLGGKITRFYYCPHDPDEHCSCRKPKPGMIQQIAYDFYLAEGPLLQTNGYAEASSQRQAEGSSLADVFVVGDSLRDLQAGRAAGARVALVKTGKGMRSLETIAREHLSDYAQVPVYTDLADFTQQLLGF